MSILKSQNLIVSPDGRILLTIKEDHENLCKDLEDVRNTTEGWTEGRSMKLTARIPTQEYHSWGDKLGYECWESNDFLKWWDLHTKGRYTV
ncbi:hypothetical protein KAR91_69205 [Candidatus Pacearchaeota archaeon]|nr:hypothetical protein [Candidatus Pacearchaeota archaeon]